VTRAVRRVRTARRPVRGGPSAEAVVHDEQLCDLPGETQLPKQRVSDRMESPASESTDDGTPILAGEPARMRDRTGDLRRRGPSKMTLYRLPLIGRVTRPVLRPARRHPHAAQSFQSRQGTVPSGTGPSIPVRGALVKHAQRGLFHN
jgi:hypothetical protein